MTRCVRFDATSGAPKHAMYCLRNSGPAGVRAARRQQHAATNTTRTATRRRGQGDNGPVSSTHQSPGSASTRPGTANPADPDTRFHVCVVCLGNICRSPIGEQVLRAALADAGLADRVRVSSAGLGDWHVGQGANERTVRVLAAAGYPTEHLVRQINRRGLAEVDLALVADRGHLTELRAMTSDPDKVVLFRSFDPDADNEEVPDPYFGPDSGFDEVMAITVSAVPGIVDDIRRRLDSRRGNHPDSLSDNQVARP